ERMREAVALEYGIALFRQYGEEQAAHFLSKDLSTVKRWRAKKLIPHIRLGERGVRYFGFHIVDALIQGTGPWDDEPPISPSSSGPTGSTNGKSHPSGTDAGT